MSCGRQAEQSRNHQEAVCASTAIAEDASGDLNTNSSTVYAIPTNGNMTSDGYTRGLDLSGTPEGAGGIGGLLARTTYGQELPGAPTTSFYHADGNGNVTALIYPNQQLAARYLYDPFGNMLAMSGPLMNLNKYRFSSKEWIDNSGLYYYDRRFYNPNSQRWINRDPTNERGGVNLYEFTSESPINNFDPFGLACPCGPNVTTAVQNVLLSVQNDFNAPTTTSSEKCTACQELYNPGTAPDAWDIWLLTSLGEKKGVPDCARTVYYKGQCVWASALNYILFGKANALCNAQFSNQPYSVFGFSIDWSEFDMNIGIEIHKTLTPGGLFTPEALSAFDFAEEGFSGSNPGFFAPDGPGGCDTTSVKPFPGALNWHWARFH